MNWAFVNELAKIISQTIKTPRTFWSIWCFMIETTRHK
jgi:hypothetical protein